VSNALQTLEDGEGMADHIIELRGISKTYPGVTALKGVDLAIGRGEVLGLVGENGAGKSTLMKILGGVVSPSSGTIAIDGIEQSELSVKTSTKAGIAFVHQELNLFENLSVASNILIGRESKFGGFLRLIDEAGQRARVEPLLKRLGVDFGPDDMVEDLSIAQCQMVEIAKALSIDARVIIMDEPTSSLTLTETKRLLKVIAELKASGVTIIYISHRLSEVTECADRVIVLRDGRWVGSLAKRDITHDAMIRLMIGRKLQDLYIPPKANVSSTGLAVEGLSTTTFPEVEVSFNVNRGEIVGMAGLVGCGRTAVAQAIFGIDAAISGRVFIDGNEISMGNVESAIANGVYLVPEDRKKAGLVLDFAVGQNITLANVRRYSSFGFLSPSREKAVAETQRQKLAIKTPSIDTIAMSLSGGNQQKIVLGKWMSMTPNVVMFDEPTRGIDVGAKSEIYALMRALADAGVAILMISSDMEEMLGVSDRIIVMHEGRVSGHLSRNQFSEHNALTLAVGGKLEQETRIHA
jgi:ribose transport system ATP-binding protein